MSSDLVSVIIPVYNSERFIEECVLSVISQTMTNLEIIVVNDGSTDNTLSILEKIKENDDRVNVFTISNSGRAKARNYGIDKVNGNWIAFLDADDLWVKDKVEKQLNNAKEHKADLVYTHRTWIDDNSTPVEQPPRHKLPSGFIFENLIESNYVCTSTVLVKTKNVRNEKGFSESQIFTNAQDYDLWIRLSHNSKFSSIEEELCLYRLHDSNAHKNIKNRFIGLRGCIETMKSGLKKYDLKTSQTIHKKISVRELSISRNFARGLFHANANVECMLALNTVSDFTTLTLKERVFKVLSYLKAMININD